MFWLFGSNLLFGVFFFFQAEDGIRDLYVTGVQTCALPICGVDVTITAKDLGYELRCAPPGAHDISYCRSLGYWAVRFLLEGGSNAMLTIQARSEERRVGKECRSRWSAYH